MGQILKAIGHVKRNQESNCIGQKMTLLGQLVLVKVGEPTELSFK